MEGRDSRMPTTTQVILAICAVLLVAAFLLSTDLWTREYLFSTLTPDESPATVGIARQPASSTLQQSNSFSTSSPQQLSNPEDQLPNTSTLETHSNRTILAAPKNTIYHAAFPDFGGTEDVVTAKRVQAFQELAQKNIAWAYFSDNWTEGISFPHQAVTEISEAGTVPFIRIMPRSGFFSNRADPTYSLEAIAAGEYDDELSEWFRDAAAFEQPLLVEFGTEMNAEWFSWNGSHNGAGATTGYGDPEQADGPEVFRDAYRHIVSIAYEQDATNITWFFHVNALSVPQEPWNSIDAYYPGDAYVDWIGVSIYGTQTPKGRAVSFSETLADVYPILTALSSKAPIAILEWGTTESQRANKAAWIEEAMTTLAEGTFTRVKAFSYWHESWERPNGSYTELRIDSSSESLEAYQRGVADDRFVSKATFK
jgi:beta-mannanase